MRRAKASWGIEEYGFGATWNTCCRNSQSVENAPAITWAVLFWSMHRMSREAFLIIIAAMIAGAIGFGIAVYAVPLEEIVQFRALIDAGLSSISATTHPDDGDTIVKRPTSPPSNVSTELDPLARDRSDTNSSCDPRCLGGSPTKGTAPNEVPSRDEATQNRPPSGMGGTPQAPALEKELPRFPSLAPHGGGEKAHVAPGDHSTRPGKKAK
jgi:hypothetical protein